MSCDAAVRSWQECGRSPGDVEPVQLLPTTREDCSQRVMGSGLYHRSVSGNSECYWSGHGRWQGRVPDTEGSGMHTLANLLDPQVTGMIMIRWQVTQGSVGAEVTYNDL